MNLRPQGFKLSKAILGFLQYKAAEALSPTSLRSYEHDLKLWLEHAGDVEVGQVSAPDLRAYLVWLRTDYKPRRLAGGDYPLSPKTLRNIWVSLAAFFAWFSREFEMPNPMKSVPTPKFEEKPVEPFSKEDIELVLKACDYCVDAHPENRRRFTMRRCAANRDHAIILTLLDTGLRASELCALKVGDAEMKTGKLEVKHGVLGGAKGRKGRAVFLGKATRRAVWRYLTGREDGEDQKAPLILNRGHRPFHADTLRILVTRIGRRAGVKDAHPHKFRHYAEFRTMPS